MQSPASSLLFHNVVTYPLYPSISRIEVVIEKEERQERERIQSFMPQGGRFTDEASEDESESSYNDRVRAVKDGSSGLIKSKKRRIDRSIVDDDEADELEDAFSPRKVKRVKGMRKSPEEYEQEWMMCQDSPYPKRHRNLFSGPSAAQILLPAGDGGLLEGSGWYDGPGQKRKRVVGNDGMGQETLRLPIRKKLKTIVKSDIRAARTNASPKKSRSPLKKWMTKRGTQSDGDAAMEHSASSTHKSPHKVKLHPHQQPRGGQPPAYVGSAPILASEVVALTRAASMSKMSTNTQVDRKGDNESGWAIRERNLLDKARLSSAASRSNTNLFSSPPDRRAPGSTGRQLQRENAGWHVDAFSDGLTVHPLPSPSTFFGSPFHPMTERPEDLSEIDQLYDEIKFEVEESYIPSDAPDELELGILSPDKDEDTNGVSLSSEAYDTEPSLLGERRPFAEDLSSSSQDSGMDSSDLINSSLESLSDDRRRKDSPSEDENPKQDEEDAESIPVPMLPFGDSYTIGSSFATFSPGFLGQYNGESSSKEFSSDAGGATGAVRQDDSADMEFVQGLLSECGLGMPQEHAKESKLPTSTQSTSSVSAAFDEPNAEWDATLKSLLLQEDRR